jgi:hypothetical protein
VIIVAAGATVIYYSISIIKVKPFWSL